VLLTNSHPSEPKENIMGKIAKVTNVAGCRTIAEVLQRSETNFTATMVPAQVPVAGKLYQAGGFQAIVRDDLDTVIGMVQSRYAINNHQDQLMALEHFMQQGDIEAVSVSQWDNGAILAYQFRCPGLDVVIHHEDVVSPLLTLAFAYGYPLADTAFFSDFRWFCKNQMGKVAGLTEGYRIRHKGNVQVKYADMVGKRLGELSGELGPRYQAMRQMTTKSLTGRALAEYVGEAVGASKEDVDQAWVMPEEDRRGKATLIGEVIDCYAQDDCGAPDTIWQAYNAVTRWGTHVHGRSEATRNKAMLLGEGSKLANRAWELAARMVA
jgi:hypothetical protein